VKPLPPDDDDLEVAGHFAGLATGLPFSTM
jgi:hypothetical protein